MPETIELTEEESQQIIDSIKQLTTTIAKIAFKRYPHDILKTRLLNQELLMQAISLMTTVNIKAWNTYTLLMEETAE